jgi:uncharacterized membrane protein (UPF0127 family)
MIVEIEDKRYKVQVAQTEEERAKGLSGITTLPKDKGMLFVFDEPQTVSFWMKDTLIPLDIVFINPDEEVIEVHSAKPNDLTPITVSNVQYVLEVNQGSGIKEGDEVDLEEEDDSDNPEMAVLN